ncbi:MAG: large-conductance mechanosensitive channel protein MscL [Muribaculaceae bacterium]|nr:large-conductance mechanosensitive channel protein MscL [Muribaculaceae bacterium]
MSKFLNDFKEFALKGNIVDMAVGVIIGGAFGKIVSSLVNDIIMPVVSLATGGVNFTEKKAVLAPEVTDAAGTVIKEAVTFNYGMFIQNIVDFLIIAISIFVAIRLAMKLKKKEAEPEPAPAAPEPTKEEVLLTEIRDLLQKQADVPAKK